MKQLSTIIEGDPNQPDKLDTLRRSYREYKEAKRGNPAAAVTQPMYREREVLPLPYWDDDGDNVCNLFRAHWALVLKKTPYVHPDNKEVIKQLLLYVMGQADKLDPTKGIQIVGEYGSGKSKLIKAIGNMTAEAATVYGQSFRRWFGVSYKAFKKVKDKRLQLDAILTDHNRYDLYIDDLGYEEDAKKSQVMTMGTTTAVVPEIIRARYDLWNRTGRVTLWTTNKSMDEARELYGAGTARRMGEMANTLYWRGDDLSN